MDSRITTKEEMGGFGMSEQHLNSKYSLAHMEMLARQKKDAERVQVKFAKASSKEEPKK